MKYQRVLLLVLLCIYFIAMAISSDAVAMKQPLRAEIITNIQPLSIRGTNYFPSVAPWSGTWDGHTSAETWDADMARAASLNINTVRTFLLWYDDPGMIAADGTPSETYLNRFDKFLDIAWSHGIRVIVCFDWWWTKPEARWMNAVKAFVQPHKLDGRILMWEMVNEPALEKTSQYLNACIPYVRSLDSNHLTTVQLDTTKERQTILHGIHEFPDIASYHDYYPHKVLWEKGVEAVAIHIRQTIQWNDGKPLFMGEFGTGCIGDGSPEAPSNENEQASLYGLKLHAVEQEKALGAANWALVSWATAGTTDDRTWGTFRQDYTLRPSGLLMKYTYARWAHPEQYVLYDECHSLKSWSALSSNCRVDDPHPDDSLISQTNTDGGTAVAVSDTFHVDASKMDRVEVILNNLSKGARAKVRVMDAETNDVISTIEKISEPGLYYSPVHVTPRKTSELMIVLVLDGNAGDYAIWDRIAITKKSQTSGK